MGKETSTCHQTSLVSSGAGLQTQERVLGVAGSAGVAEGPAQGRGPYKERQAWRLSPRASCQMPDLGLNSKSELQAPSSGY